MTAVGSARSRFSCLALVALGGCISGYLLYHHFVPQEAWDASICSALLGTSCAETLRSPWAEQLGLPLAGWGLVYYGTLAALLLLGWCVGPEFHFEAALGALLLGLCGAAISLLLVGVMVGGMAALCPLCIAIHATNLVLIYPLKRLTGSTTPELAGAVAATGRYLMGGDVADPQQARWKTIGFLAAGLVGVAIYQWVYVQHTVRAASSGAAFAPEETLVLFESLPPQEIPVSQDDAQTEHPGAPVRLVIFSDFQCPACMKFAGTLAAIEQRFSDRIHLVFKQFPLSNQCNPLLGRDLHPRACEAAAAAEAARRQGKFWRFHDALFAANLLKNKDVALADIADEVGIDLEQFTADRRSKSAARKVQANVDQGVSLGLDGTPAVFLNGRRVYDIRLQALEFLIGHELEHHAHSGMHDHAHSH